MEKPVLVIVGPTASGKTGLAKRLIGRLNGEVISADSRQVYKFFDIGTAKDKSFKQHLIDELDPRTETFTAADFLSRTVKLIEEIHGRGRLPIVVGGTGLYIDALVRGYHFPKGKRRRGQFKGRATPLPYQFLIFGIKLPREVLYQRIARRSETMVAAGLVAETKRLLKLLPKKHELMKTIGYKQAIDYLEGRLTEKELAPAITRATKIFVRHQGNWIKRWPVEWVSSV
ncbi:AAA family ATPase [Candidatus Berkelbacteria bacterium]|nr:AAA family ATPase [Candidatus Berkelbacteria bacterium]